MTDSLLKLTSTLQKYQGHERPEKNEKVSQTQRDKGDMATKINVQSWNEPRNSKKMLVKKLVKSE